MLADLSVVIRTTFKKIFSVEKNQFEIFDFWSNFELISKEVSNCNTLFKLNLSRENSAQNLSQFFGAISGNKT